MREDLEKKEELICDKDSQIKILQNNLNTLSTELETLKYLRPKAGAKRNSKDETNTGFGNKPVSIQGGGAKKKTRVDKSDKLFFDR